MQFTSLTRDVEIGANSYLLSGETFRIVLDAGLHPKREALDAIPDFQLLGDQPLDSILISHAHQDHIGSLPVLQRRFPDTPVLMSSPTADLTDAMLHNSVSVMTSKRDELELADYPLFTHSQANEVARQWRHCNLGQRFDLTGERLSPDEPSEVSFEFFDAGHILGSVGTLIEAEGQRVFYTGDVNFAGQSLSCAATFPEDDIDVLIMETTRGDVPEPEGFTRASEERRFAEAIEHSFERGGCTLIPVFAMGKTQELLTMLYQFRRKGWIQNRPLYIGGLSTKITGIYQRHTKSWPSNHPGIKLFEAAEPFTLNGKNISDTPADRPRIYALSSGMMVEKTLSNVFCHKMLSDPDCSLFFIGYSDPDTPAGLIRATEPGGMVSPQSHRKAQELLCEMDAFNFSGHASRESLRAYANRVRPRKIVLVHGDPSAVQWFRETLADDMPECEIVVPIPGSAIAI